MNDNIKNKLAVMPKLPGVYLWKNDRGEIIYVGKAKNLFNRTHSYFSGVKDSKTTLLVKNIADVEYRITPSVNDALLLENNLIKKHKPKYNILLKDSSSYPYIVVTDEKNPRILYTNHYGKIKGTYYGPLADSAFKKYNIYRLLESIIPFRKCHKLPNKTCIYYDIGQCLAPCIQEIDQQVYKNYKRMIANIFNRDIKEIVQDLKQKEEKAVQMLQFEIAQQYKETSDGLINLANNQVVELSCKDTMDIIGYYQKDEHLCILVCGYVNGKWLTVFSQIYDIFSDLEDVITQFLLQYYTLNKVPHRVIVNLDDESLELLSQQLETSFKKPDTKKIQDVLNNVITNAKDYLKNNLLASQAEQARTVKALEEFQQVTKVVSTYRMEVFDNSNLYGKMPVAGVNVYINGVREKGLSRHYNLPEELDGDYHYMYAVMLRRYSDMLKRHEKLPNVIIVDGGIIQINACLKALDELNISHMIDVVGLKKDDHHKTDSIVLRDGQEIKLERHSGLYYYLFNMQEDIHNFIISHFRKSYVSKTITSVLDQIPGLGPKRKSILLKNYSSLAEMKKASEQELSQILPLKIVKLLKEKLNEID